MTFTHEAVVTRALREIADLKAHAQALRVKGFDVDAAVRKLSRLVLLMEAEEADGCLSPQAWSAVMRAASPIASSNARP